MLKDARRANTEDVYSVPILAVDTPRHMFFGATHVGGGNTLLFFSSEIHTDYWVEYHKAVQVICKIVDNMGLIIPLPILNI